MRISKTDWASAAGMIESDGSVGLFQREIIYKPTGKKRIYVTAFINMTSTDLSTLKWFKKKFGGFYCKNKSKSNPKRFPGRRPVWLWTIPKRKFNWFLSNILPYIRSKNKYKRIDFTLKQRIAVESNHGTGRTRNINYWNLYKRYKREVL